MTKRRRSGRIERAPDDEIVDVLRDRQPPRALALEAASAVVVAAAS